MFDWLSEQYVRLVLNYNILLGNPTGCGTVELLRLFSYTLLGVFTLKLLSHVSIFRYLKHRFERYGKETHSDLWRIFLEAADRVGLRRLPRLYRFENALPQVFTIGTLTPAVFIAPKIVEKLPPDELEAVLLHELTHVKRRDNLLIWGLEIFFLAIPLLIVQMFAIRFVFSVQNSAYALFGTLALLLLFKTVLWKRIIFLRELSCDDLSVRQLGDPLVLAAALVNVWRLGTDMPQFKLHRGLAFTQTMLPPRMTLESRVRRLLNYRPPRLKFFFGKAARLASLVFVILFSVFLLHFHRMRTVENITIQAGSRIDVCQMSCRR